MVSKTSYDKHFYQKNIPAHVCMYFVYDRPTAKVKVIFVGITLRRFEKEGLYIVHSFERVYSCNPKASSLRVKPACHKSVIEVY